MVRVVVVGFGGAGVVEAAGSGNVVVDVRGGERDLVARVIRPNQRLREEEVLGSRGGASQAREEDEDDGGGDEREQDEVEDEDECEDGGAMSSPRQVRIDRFRGVFSVNANENENVRGDMAREMRIGRRDRFDGVGELPEARCKLQASRI